MPADLLRHARLAVLALAVSLPASLASAEEPVDPEVFGTEAEGYTLYFDQHGQPYGVEQFLPGRRTIWAFHGDRCLEGEWYVSGEAMCFVYDGHPSPHCWTIHRDGDTLRVRALGADPSQDLILVRRSREPMFCPGPDVGA